MLSIRMSRTGKKKLPLYSLIVTEKTRDPWGKYTEKLGTYNPHTKASELKSDRITYWISKGAQPTETVHNLLVTLGIIKADKVVAGKTKMGKKRILEAKNKQKAEEDAKAKAEAEAKAKAEAEAKAAEEAAAVAAAPAVEEVVVEAPVEEVATEPVVEEVKAE
jgi:small subunit ribosomal protein S16